MSVENAEPAPALVWTRVDRYHESADTGHAVAACRTPAGWRFCAFGPRRRPELHYYEWPPEDLGGRIHYPRGSQVPLRNLPLGVYTTAAAARAACARDAATSTPEDRC